MKLSLYCDGSSSGKKDGPIGWSWILLVNEKITNWDYGGQPDGTNNIAELLAAINGLKYIASKPNIVEKIIKKEWSLEVVSDSQYVLNMADQLFSPTTNHDLVQEIIDLKHNTGASTRWIRGHSGEQFNERCDRLAKLGRDLFIPGTTIEESTEESSSESSE